MSYNDSDDDSIPPPPPPPPLPPAAAAAEELEIQSTPTLARLKSGGKIRTSSRQSGRFSSKRYGKKSKYDDPGVELSVDNVERGNNDGKYVLNVDETRSAATSNSKSSTKKKKCLIFWVVFLLVAGGVGAALGIIFTKDKSTDADAAKKSSEATGDDASATADVPASDNNDGGGTSDIFPIAETPTAPTGEIVKEDLALEILRKVLPTKAYTALSDPYTDTAQSDALDFILNDDEFVYDWDGLASTPIDTEAQITFVQRYTAATIYMSTDGEDWDNNEGWMGKLNVCTWYGVGCDEAGRVTTLSLSDNNLNGPIPADLNVFENLHTIELHKNRLSGEIPSSIYDMNQLKILYLDENELSGEISGDIGRMIMLEKLTLNDNEFSGTLPSELGELENLDMLWLYNNPDIGGTIPVEISNCTELSKCLCDA